MAFAQKARFAAESIILGGLVVLGGIRLDSLIERQIKKAEGMKQAAILQAEGQAQAIVKVAEAEAAKIEKINTAIQKYFRNVAQMYKKLETIQYSLENNTKYVIDPHTAITNVIAEQMAGIIPVEKKGIPEDTSSS